MKAWRKQLSDAAFPLFYLTINYQQVHFLLHPLSKPNKKLNSGWNVSHFLVFDVCASLLCYMKRIENKDENDEKVPSFNAIHFLFLQSSCFRHLGGTKGQCFAITQAAIDPTLKTNPISEYVVILDKIIRQKITTIEFESDFNVK